MIIRDTPTANRTYYVSTTGNDSNTGLDAADAFLTIQRAVNVVCDTLDNMGYAITIQVADGAYNAAVALKPYVGSGLVTLQGNTTTPANVTITLSGSVCISAVNISQSWRIAGFTFSTTGVAANCLQITGSRVNLAAIAFGACSGTQIGVNETTVY